MTQFVIVQNSYGAYHVYDANLKNAMMVFESHTENMDSEVINIATNTAVQYIDNKNVLKVLEEILKAKMKDPLPKMRNFLYGLAPKEGKDLRPEVVKTKVMMQELSLYMVENNLTQEMFERGYVPTKHNFVEQLDFFAPFKERIGKSIEVTESSYLEMARDYNTIINKKWKVDALEHKIVERILQFVNEYLVDTSDCNYSVSTLEKIYK